MRSEQFQQGARFATKRAIEMLHERAREMNDLQARAILNAAAFHLARELKEFQEARALASKAKGEG